MTFRRFVAAALLLGLTAAPALAQSSTGRSTPSQTTTQRQIAPAPSHYAGGSEANNMQSVGSQNSRDAGSTARPSTYRFRQAQKAQ